MDVADLILADYAAANENGKFTLVGAGFTEIASPNIPIIHPLMFILVRVKIKSDDKGQNHFELRIVGEKGVVFKTEGNLGVNDVQRTEQHVVIPIRLQNLKFDQPGEYNIEVILNGALKQSQILGVRHIPRPLDPNLN